MHLEDEVVVDRLVPVGSAGSRISEDHSELLVDALKRISSKRCSARRSAVGRGRVKVLSGSVVVGVLDLRR